MNMNWQAEPACFSSYVMKQIVLKCLITGGIGLAAIHESRVGCTRKLFIGGIKIEQSKISGLKLESDRTLAREAGFDDYMVKPLEIEKLQSILRGK